MIKTKEAYSNLKFKSFVSLYCKKIYPFIYKFDILQKQFEQLERQKKKWWDISGFEGNTPKQVFNLIRNKLPKNEYIARAQYNVETNFRFTEDSEVKKGQILQSCEFCRVKYFKLNSCHIITNNWLRNAGVVPLEYKKYENTIFNRAFFCSNCHDITERRWNEASCFPLHNKNMNRFLQKRIKTAYRIISDLNLKNNKYKNLVKLTTKLVEEKRNFDFKLDGLYDKNEKSISFIERERKKRLNIITKRKKKEIKYYNKEKNSKLSTIKRKYKKLGYKIKNNKVINWKLKIRKKKLNSEKRLQVKVVKKQFNQKIKEINDIKNMVLKNIKKKYDKKVEKINDIANEKQEKIINKFDIHLKKLKKEIKKVK